MGDSQVSLHTVTSNGTVVVMLTNHTIVMPSRLARPVTHGWIQEVLADPTSKKLLRLDWKGIGSGFGNPDE